MIRTELEKANEFREELEALLSKYDAEICFEVDECSDTHGIYDEHFTVCLNGSQKAYRISNDGEWSISTDQLKEIRDEKNR